MYLERKQFRQERMKPLLVALLASTLSWVSADNILLLPCAGNSHVSYFKALGEELHKTHRHKIVMMLPPSYPGINETATSSMSVITFENKEADFNEFDINPEEMGQLWLSVMEKGVLWDLRENAEFMMPSCRNPLSDETLFRKLKEMNIKIAIIDAFPYSRCLAILLYRLGIPFVSLTTQYEPWLFRNPSLPSFVPFAMTRAFTEKMTFWERLLNTLSLVDWSAFPRSAVLDDNLVATYAPEMPFRTLNELFSQSLLWLLNSDPVLDYARPTMANVIEVGGLTTKPGNKLPAEIEKLINNKNSRGVIVISFGSYVDTLPSDLMRNIADAFRAFPDYTVIWKYSLEAGRSLNVSSNVKIVPWIPQNDLLSDKRTRLFITHCGNNGQFEAMYHAVPMLGFPLFADQLYNGARIQYREYGLSLPILKSNSKDVVQAMKTILDDPKYKANIQKASDIFRDREHPVKRASYWIDHVMRFGGDHLHSYALDMPWYEYLMLDILALFLVIELFIVYIILKCCRCTVQRLCGSAEKKLKVH